MKPSHLYKDHQRLDALFEDVVNRTETQEWWLCDEIWDRFTSDLEAHMAFEEREVFPRLIAERPALEPIVCKLAREHDALRAAAFRIGVSLQTHRFDPAEARELIARLRAHAEEENRTIYPPLAAPRVAPLEHEESGGAPAASTR